MLGPSNGAYYHKSKGPSKQDLDICSAIDVEHDKHPAKGVRQMHLALLALGLVVGIKKVRRLMRRMGIETYYAKPHLSRLGRAKYVHTYLLRKMRITNPNQVWSTDITYNPMRPDESDWEGGENSVNPLPNPLRQSERINLKNKKVKEKFANWFRVYAIIIGLKVAIKMHRAAKGK